ncbi:hypothetical protein DM01DRAFT_1338004 [Hesseltinella vesiculosa]|uniref:Nudix hydrolase domain-containing protein n=1 Tax=Hesseltinella vesiculosa TaxID=101127 RepID=A0A1X2GBJ5_9FUNG|nr:hypothetical protein DM01DRAFT_1338004 [Hesseltinella vesiculosa]
MSMKLYRSVASIMVRRPPLNVTHISKESSTAANDLHSLARLPSSWLYLLVKKPRKDHAWQFPQGGIDKGESVLQGALRELAEECGSSIKVRALDNDPVCVFRYDYPPDFMGKRARKYRGPEVRVKVEKDLN